MRRKDGSLIVLLVGWLGVLVAFGVPTINHPVQEQTVQAEKHTVKKKKAVWKKYKVTAYCPCHKCSGRWGRMTSTGTTAKQGRTIAVDPKVIPYGTKLHLKGIGKYTAEDCGAKIKGNKLDVYFDNHEDAVNFGVQTVKVRIIQKGDK